MSNLEEKKKIVTEAMEHISSGYVRVTTSVFLDDSDYQLCACAIGCLLLGLDLNARLDEDEGGFREQIATRLKPTFSYEEVELIEDLFMNARADSSTAVALELFKALLDNNCDVTAVRDLWRQKAIKEVTSE